MLPTRAFHADVHSPPSTADIKVWIDFLRLLLLRLLRLLLLQVTHYFTKAFLYRNGMHRRRIILLIRCWFHLSLLVYFDDLIYVDDVLLFD